MAENAPIPGNTPTVLLHAGTCTGSCTGISRGV